MTGFLNESLKCLTVVAQVTLESFLNLGEEFLLPSSVHFLQGRKDILVAGNLEGSLNCVEHADFPSRDEDDGISFSPSSPGTADTVGIGLQVERGIVVKNVRNAIDVESAGRNVGRYQDVELAPF